MNLSETSRPTVAVLGTGPIGAPMARNLLAAGFPVRAWNRTSAHAAKRLGDGAQIADSPAAAANPAVHVAIVGSRHTRHIVEAIGALEMQLDGDDLAEIDRIMTGAVTAAGPSPETAR